MISIAIVYRVRMHHASVPHALYLASRVCACRQFQLQAKLKLINLKLSKLSPAACVACVLADVDKQLQPTSIVT